MRLLRVQISDFLSHAETDLPVESLPPLTLILGVGDGQSESSNGAGKSALLDAISWGLFGKTIRDTSSVELVRHGQKKCKVDLSLMHDGRTIKISRTKDVGQSSSEFSVEMDKPVGGSIAEKQAFLNKLIGLDFDLFRNTYYFGQSEGSEFLAAADKGRKDFICRVLNAGILDLAKSRSDEERLRATTFLELVKSSGSAARADLEELRLPEGQDARAVERRIVQLESRLSDLKTQYRPESNDRVKKLEEDSYQAGSLLVKEKETLAELRTELTSDPPSSAARKLAKLEHREGLESRRERSRTLAASYTKELAKLERRSRGLKDRNECPWCMTILSGGKKDALAERLETEMRKLHDGIRASNAEAETAISALLVCNYRVCTGVVEELKDKVETIDSKLDAARARLGDQMTLRNEIARVEAELAKLRTALGRAQEYELRVKNAESKLAEARKKYKAYLSDVKSWTLLSEAFGQRGLRAILVDRVAPLLEAETNRYLQDLSRVPIAVTMESRTEDRYGAILDRFEIFASIRGRTQPLDLCSGGEKRRIVVALRLSLSKLLRINYPGRERGKYACLMLDEFTDDLDTDGTQRLMGLLQAQESEFSRILLISHSERLQNLVPSDSIIWVENKNGVSRVRLPGGTK